MIGVNTDRDIGGQTPVSIQHIPVLDGLRLIAILPVIFWHAGLRGLRNFLDQFNLGLQNEDLWLPNGHIGVFLFFFISGFVISAPAFARGSAPDVLKFYWNRLRRLYVPYILVVIGCGLLLFISGREVKHFDGSPTAPGYVFQSILASTGFVHQLVLGEHPNVNPPLWSLEIEMQFYLLAPFILMLLVRLKNLWQLLAILLATCLMNVAITVSTDAFRQDHSWLYFAYLFMLGSVMAWLFRRMRGMNIRLSYRTDLLFLAGLTLLCASGFYEELKVVPLWMAIARPFVHVLAISLICFGAFYGRATNAFLSMRWVISLGIACYSIYLTHVPLIEMLNKFAVKRLVFSNEVLTILADMAVLTLAALAAGLAYHVIIERRFMSRRQLDAVAKAPGLKDAQPAFVCRGT